MDEKRRGRSVRGLKSVVYATQAMDGDISLTNKTRWLEGAKIGQTGKAEDIVFRQANA